MSLVFFVYLYLLIWLDSHRKLDCAEYSDVLSPHGKELIFNQEKEKNDI